MNKDEILRALCAELKCAHFGEFIQQLSDSYERTEHELASGLEIQDSQARAEHERIKAKIQAGSSLADAMIDRVFEWYAKKYSEEHGLTKSQSSALARYLSSSIRRSMRIESN
jgi:hypothetical protein